MKCVEAADLIRDYADRELAAEQASPLERHLLKCADCAARLEAERELKQALRAHGRADPAPAGLAAQIARELRAGEWDVPRAAHAAPRAGGRRRGLMVAALVLAALALGWAWRALRFAPAPAATGMVALMVEDHIRCCAADAGTDGAARLLTDDPGAAERWLAERISLAPALPRLAAQGLELREVRVCRVGERPAVMAGYQDGRRRWTLFVLNATGLGLPAMSPVGPRGFPCTIDSHRGFRCVCWLRDGRLYALVADAEQEPMVDLVAHAFP